jgi:hypothetical protein
MRASGLAAIHASEASAGAKPAQKPLACAHSNMSPAVVASIGVDSVTVIDELGTMLKKDDARAGTCAKKYVTKAPSGDRVTATSNAVPLKETESGVGALRETTSTRGSARGLTSAIMEVESDDVTVTSTSVEPSGAHAEVEDEPSSSDKYVALASSAAARDECAF